MVSNNAAQLQEVIKKGLRLGKGVSVVHPTNWGSEPYLIKIGEGSTISFDVAFVNHDGGTRVVRQLPGQNKETVIYGTIEIGKNCFIGCRSVILPNVKIGDNTIIGAGSIVTKDIPANSVACGVPCKVVCTIDEYIDKHKNIVKDFDYVVSWPYDKKRKYLEKKFGIKR